MPEKNHFPLTELTKYFMTLKVQMMGCEVLTQAWQGA